MTDVIQSLPGFAISILARSLIAVVLTVDGLLWISVISEIDEMVDWCLERGAKYKSLPSMYTRISFWLYVHACIIITEPDHFSDPPSQLLLLSPTFCCKMWLKLSFTCWVMKDNERLV